MEEREISSTTNPSGRVLTIVAAVIPAALFIALRQLHEPKILFQEVLIMSQDPHEPWATVAEMARAQAELIRRAHIEMVVVTVLGLALLFFLFNRNRTKYLLIASAGASLAACLLNW
jgi:hypothetical protein